MEEAMESKSTVERIVALALPVMAMVMIFYQLIYTQYLIQGPTAHKITHLGLGFTVVLLSLIHNEKKGRPLRWVLLVISLAFSSYLMINLGEIMLYRQSIPLASDIVIGVVVLITTFIVAYQVLGKTFVIIAGACIVYLVLGRFLPHPFTVAPVSFSRIIMWLSAGVGIEQGVYGPILGLSANYLFLLIVFGGMLYAFGGVRFIMGVGKWLGSKFKSGPAAVAVVGSSLLGSMTGSTVANVTITGAYTIPLMKKGGYEPKQAGAIEAASSNGGQIMPPVMGATAFIMSGFTGIPYIQIAAAVLIPAILYYLGLLIYVQINAYKLDIQVEKEVVSGKELLLDAPLFVVPLGVLILLLVQGFSLPFVVFWSIVSLVTLSLILSIRKEARLSFKEVVAALTKSARTACDVTIINALIGVVATCIETSGLGIKLPLLVGEISQGILIIALFITMISSIFVGMGVPTPAAYMLVAIGAAPALVKMGVPLLQAHLFPFIFAVFSHLTPPIAIGALVASQLAEAEYWPTSWEALKAASTAFILPYLIVFAPVIVLRPDAGFIVSAIQIVAIPLGVLSLQITFSSYFIGTVDRINRAAFGVTALLFFGTVFSRSILFLSAALALLAFCIGSQILKRRQLKTLGAPGELQESG
ncbi:MAG: TRAP transporter fused permease subunit [Desulfobacterales bacterium]|jgi:TRAP transporter 4TM/12TM fusion protein|nr:TRAP transporter fused permease subunit [Desulfobacterales bacterium]